MSPSKGPVPGPCSSGASEFDPLDDQLGDAHAAGDGDGGVAVEVDQADLDLPAVVRVDGAGGVDDAQPLLGGQPGARVDEADGAQRQGQGDAGAHELPLAGGEGHILGAVEVDAGVAAVGAGGQGQVLVQSLDADRAEFTHVRHGTNLGHGSMG